MTLARFKVIRRMLRFDNVSTRQGCLNRNNFAAVRLLIDGFLKIVKVHWYRVKLLQLIRSVAQYVLTFWLLCRSSTYYCFNSQFYFGKEEERQRCVSLAQHVVLPLARPLFNARLFISTGTKTVCNHSIK